MLMMPPDAVRPTDSEQPALLAQGDDTHSLMSMSQRPPTATVQLGLYTCRYDAGLFASQPAAHMPFAKPAAPRWPSCASCGGARAGSHDAVGAVLLADGEAGDGARVLSAQRVVDLVDACRYGTRFVLPTPPVNETPSIP